MSWYRLYCFASCSFSICLFSRSSYYASSSLSLNAGFFVILTIYFSKTSGVGVLVGCFFSRDGCWRWCWGLAGSSIITGLGFTSFFFLETIFVTPSFTVYSSGGLRISPSETLSSMFMSSPSDWLCSL